MSEYYLADMRAKERAKQRPDEGDAASAPQGQEMKVTLLGDFAFPSSEPQGFDPYNNVHGQSPRDAWRATRGRR